MERHAMRKLQDWKAAPQYHIISAGSLLGLALHDQTSFPVGKVNFLDLHPFSYMEFLNALDQHALVDLEKGMDWELIKSFKEKLIHNTFRNIESILKDVRV